MANDPPILAYPPQLEWGQNSPVVGAPFYEALLATLRQYHERISALERELETTMRWEHDL